MIGDSNYFKFAKGGYHQHYMNRFIDCANNLPPDLDKLRKKNPNVDNDILITRTLGKIDDYASVIIILLEKLNES